jgi:hypothetical protein
MMWGMSKMDIFPAMMCVCVCFEVVANGLLLREWRGRGEEEEEKGAGRGEGGEEDVSA